MTTRRRRSCPLDGRRTAGHNHVVSWDMWGNPPLLRGGAVRRSFRGDRCNSQLLWATVSLAVMKDADPYLDGKPLSPKWTKERSWAYLLTCAPTWRRGLSDPTKESA